MTRNADRYASSECRALAVGTTARLPLSLRRCSHLGNPVYRHPWMIVAFAGGQMRHCAIVRRLADGQIRTVSQHLFAFYLNS